MALLKDKLKNLTKYFRNLQYQGDMLIIEVQYPDKIVPFGTKDKRIQVASSEDVPNVWFYYGKADKVSEDEIFQIMQETVRGYEETLEKVNLMREKMQELKNMFVNNSIDKLRTLKFVFDAEKKKKTVRKPKEKEITEVSEPNETTEVTKENTEE